MDEPINIAEFLAAFGLSAPEEQAHGRELLEQAGITHPGKRNMARAKEAQAEFILHQYYARHCGGVRCLERLLTAKDGRQKLVVERPLCEVCGGSHSRRALEDLAEAMLAANLRRLLVVGGTSKQHEDLRKSLPDAIECQAVLGTGHVTQTTAKAQLQGNDVVAIWVPTPLPHKVSNLYEHPEYRHKTVKIYRRGVASLAEDVIAHLKSRG